MSSSLKSTQNNVTQDISSRWITVSTIGVMFYAILLFLYPKGYILGSVILLVLSIAAGWCKKLTWHKNLTLLAIAFVMFTIPHIISFLQETGDMSSIKKAARGIPLLLAAALLIRFKPKQQAIYASFAISLIIAFIIMINEQVIGFERGDYAGFNLNPLMTAIVAVIAFILPSIHTNSIKLRILAYTGICLGVLTVIMSGSKGPFLGLLIVILVFIFMPSRDKPSSNKKYIRFIILSLMGLIMVASMGTNNELFSRTSMAIHNLTSHFENPSSESQISSTAIRLELWKGALVLATEKPIFGYGMTQAQERMGELYEQGYLAKYMGTFTKTHFHSMYFQALGNRGLFGLFTVLFLLIIPTYILLKNKLVNPTYSLSGLLVIISYIITGIADVSLSSTLASSTYFILIIIGVSQVSIYKK
ncbi:O-antigen ligase family protein [Moritella dasanensis]|uniref:O-antigen ligase family protein n=1 Tax=Moritella dasanensis TaxID=428031 RepID=UPI0002D94404|nr:O-antigen ligase family protein [Moritella dasanensis]